MRERTLYGWRVVIMAHGVKPLLLAVLVGTAWGAGATAATTLPADLCSLLPAAQVSKTTGQGYDSPTKTVAPRPFADTVEGSDCHYKQSKGSGSILFRAYADPSSSEAASLFARLAVFYSPQTPVPGLGDKAYFDPKHGLHVLKGSVRFFISMDKFDETQAKALANGVVLQL
jgi:hypothetical protein